MHLRFCSPAAVWAILLMLLVSPVAQADEKDHPVLKAVLAGKAPAGNDLKAAPAAKMLSAAMPSISLLSWDKPQLIAIPDFAQESVIVVHLTQPDSLDALSCDVLKALQKRHNKSGLHLVTLLLGEAADAAKLAGTLKEQSIDWLVALDDYGEFRAFAIRESYYLPSFLVIGRDRKAHWVSLGKKEESLASLCRTVEEEIARKPGKRPNGPVAYYRQAESFSAAPIAGVPEGKVQFVSRPAILVCVPATDTGSHLQALNEIAKRHGAKVDVVAVVSAEAAEQAQSFAKDKSFRVLHEQGALPGCYGPVNRYRVAMISAGGRVLKVILLNSSGSYLPIYERYARLLTTPNALPGEVNSAGRTNIALQINGGHVESAASATEGDSGALLNGKTGQTDWAAEGKGKPEVVLSFRGGQDVNIDRIWLDGQSRIQDVEFLAGDDLKSRFRSLGVFRMEDRLGVQAFTFLATKTKYLKVRLLSTYEANLPFALGEIGVEEVAGAAPAVAFKNGFSDEFAQGRLTYWQQENVANLRTQPVWKIEKGKLVQPSSYQIQGFDNRSTALLHAYPVEGNYRFEATVTKPSGHFAGLMVGFRDWDNFDSVLLLEAQVLAGRREGNSIRLERRRQGKTRVLSIHGEWFDQSKPVRLEVISQGATLSVKANDRLILSAPHEGSASAGRMGFCTAGASGSTFERVRLTPLTGSAEPVLEMNPLSTAAGATIVWLSGQGGEKEPQTWASHLLRDAAMSTPGAWVAPRKDGKPPEVILAFRDAREVTLEEIGFTLPTAGDARERARKIEVLVTRDSPLLSDRFRSVGTFELKDDATAQTFRLAKPEPARYLMIRLVENRGSEKMSLARVWAKLGAEPKPLEAAATHRSEVEQTFATAAKAKEQEPNETITQASKMTEGLELEANIQPGEVDLFRLPDRPNKKGRMTLHWQMSALPWLRLQADFLDGSGKTMTPPLLRPQAGQVMKHTSQQSPQFARVEMSNASLSVVLDMSGSMSGREKDVSAVIKKFFEGVTAAEQVEVLSFASDVKELAAFTNDRKALEPIAGKVRFDGATALYKGLLRSLDHLSARSGNRAILLMSDGMNTIPGEDFAELSRKLRKQPIPIYVVGVGQDLFEYDAASGNTCADLLRNLALMTGGRFYFAPTSAELGKLYQQIADEMRGATRYRLLARWEVSEQVPELVSSAAGDSKPLPFSGPLPPASLDLVVTEAPRGLSVKSGGLPPAPFEMAKLERPGVTLKAHLLSLPSPFELGIERASMRPSLPAYLALPAAWELAWISSRPPSPRLLEPVPEFGAVSVVYQVERNSTSLPVTLRPAIELILDSSGSMKEQMEGAPKYQAARRVMTNLMKALPDDATVGLRVFGHMRFWDPNKEPMPDVSDKRYHTDSELVVSMGQFTQEKRKHFQEWIDYLTPKGATPLVYSLVKASADFPPTWKGPKTVILISDGVETCGGKLEDVEKAYRGADVNLIIHVVGFDVKDAKEQEYLKSLARIGRGQYFNAANSEQLADALKKALSNIGYQIQDAGGKTVASGVVNGPRVELEAGQYSLVIPGTTLKPVSVRIGSGKLSAVTLDAEGQLVAPRPRPIQFRRQP